MRVTGRLALLLAVVVAVVVVWRLRHRTEVWHVAADQPDQGP
jgi:hypothetical protein